MTFRDPPDFVAGRYRLREHLGKGGFADVYIAEDERLERDVAIKFLLPERLQDAKNKERFMREARTIARLSHPNIVQVYDLGEQDDWHFLVMEYIDGQTLHQYLDEQGEALAFDEAVAISTDILSALAYAHENRIIHRDIKPENILLTAEGQVKVTDFGLALRQEDVRLTESGAFVGTLLYLPPEVIQGEGVDHRADLYAFGATFYEMLTGQPIVNARDSLNIMREILQMPLTLPSLVNPDIPEEIEAIVIQLLEKDPDDRYESARSVLDALPDPDTLREMQAEQLRQTIDVRLSQSRFERIIRSSSDMHHTPDEAASDEPIRETILDTTQHDLLIYAAQEDTLEALEAERRRLAMRLQETIISQINLILAQVNSYELTMGGGDTHVRMAFSVLSTLIRQLLQDTHDFEASLHPAVLETLGLEPALESLANQHRRISGVNITLSLQRMRERLPAPIELVLFRTTQDAVERAVKQGNATQLIIQLEKNEEGVQYSIADNGLIPSGDVLRSAKQRLQALGGSMSLQSSRYGGLEIIIRFTFEQPIELTEREMDVIELLAEGLTNKEIAAVLHVRPRTVKFHLDNIYSKLNVNTRTEAAIYALRHGWIRRDTPV